MSFSASVSELVEASKDSRLGIAPWWQRVPLSFIATILNGYPWRSDRFNDRTGAPVIRIRDVTSGSTVTFYEGEIVDGYWVDNGDLLIGMDGDFNSCIWFGGRALLNQRVCKVSVAERLYNPAFLSKALPAYLVMINTETHSVTVKHLSSKTIGDIPLPLPPLAEQRRIVVKLDALDASAKRARADLDRIPTLVARAKQAILAEVFRQASKSCKELVAIEELVREDAPICYGVVQPGDDKEHGVPLVRVCDLVQGRVDWTAIRTVTPEIAAQYDRSRIKDGDVLVSVVGTIGRVAVAREVPPNCNIARAVARIRPKSERASSEWLSIALQAPQVQERFMADSREVARKTLNISLLKEVEIPEIPIELQAEIVRRIEAAFAKIDRVAAEAASARGLLDRLDQAILAKAFRGELVPQDPSDEPAEKLLEKIKAARAALPAHKARKKQS